MLNFPPVLTSAADYFQKRYTVFVNEWVRVYTANNPAEVGYMRGLLEAEGVATQARNMDLWAAAVEVYFAAGARPSVWVRAVDAERAERILAGRDRSGSGASWVCPGCEETLEGQFTACWRCGQPRTGDG